MFIIWLCLGNKIFLSFETTGQLNSLPIQLEAKVNEYLSLIMRLIFAFGLSFQLPVLLNLLARIGAIDSKYLKRKKKIFYCNNFCCSCNINTSRSCNTNWFGNTFVNTV